MHVLNIDLSILLFKKEASKHHNLLGFNRTNYNELIGINKKKEEQTTLV